MISVFLFIALLLQSALLVYPLVKRKFGQNPPMLSTQDAVLISHSVAGMAKSMLSSKGVVMSFNDDQSLYALLAGVKNRVLGNHSHRTYAYFNFPLAFLMLGLLDHYVATKDAHTLRDVERKCNDLLSEAGELKFKVDKIDQAVFGLVFLRLYELTRNGRYLKGAHHIYGYLLQFRGKEGLYRYRLGLDVFFIDTVGLLCPFLVEYANVSGIVSAKVDAERQVNFVFENCVEPHQGLAFHAFDLTLVQPLGSTNWARGMGWFMLGLSAVARTSSDSMFMDAMRHYSEALSGMRESHGFWPQFLGHTNDKQIDSSGTVMFIYAFQKCEIITVDPSLIGALSAKCIDRRGRVVQASGDTIYINKYSRLMGPSELSQGLMLSIISGATR